MLIKSMRMNLTVGTGAIINGYWIFVANF
jgi:hypothetical protein